MGYFNTFLAWARKRFISDAAAAGADGLIIVDLPPEESDETLALCRKHGLDLIFLAAPTSDEARIDEIVAAGVGLHLLRRRGGRHRRQGAALGRNCRSSCARLRAKTDLPLAVGFGISKREHIEALQGLADAAIVGAARWSKSWSHRLETSECREFRDYVEVLTGRLEAST